MKKLFVDKLPVLSFIAGILAMISITIEAVIYFTSGNVGEALNWLAIDLVVGVLTVEDFIKIKLNK